MTYYIRWIVYKHQTDTVETEQVTDADLNTLVDRCKDRLDEVRLRHSDRPPTGFQVLSEDGDILRQWVDPNK